MGQISPSIHPSAKLVTSADAGVQSFFWTLKRKKFGWCALAFGIQCGADDASRHSAGCAALARIKKVPINTI